MSPVLINADCVSKPGHKRADIFGYLVEKSVRSIFWYDAATPAAPPRIFCSPVQNHRHGEKFPNTYSITIRPIDSSLP
jgi:hypothetical protein